MKVDLTPAELREWARLCDLGFKRAPDDSAEWWRVWCAIRQPPHTMDSTLALALADAMEERDRLRLARGFLDRDAEVLKAALLTAQEELTTRGGELVQLRADLEAAREAINYATENILDYDDAEWAAWNAMPAVRAALGKDADGND